MPRQARPEHGKHSGPKAALIAAAFAMAGATALHAQLPTGGTTTLTTTTVPDWVGTLSVASSDGTALSIANQLFVPDPESTHEELPGLGHKFELFGTMARDTDPDNQYGNSGGSGGGVGGNEVISSTLLPGQLAFAYRALPPGIKIRALTNQIGFKYYFVAPKTCAAGGTRIVLFVDKDGDGDWDFSANGHVNPAFNYTACPMNKWVYEDLTDDLPRWEATGLAVPGLPSYPYAPWKTFVTAVTAAFPNHRVFAGFLLDGESCTSAVAVNCGKAYYDLLTLENRTLEIWQDTVKK